MQRFNVKEIKEGDFLLTQTFMITDLKEMTTKAGKPYAIFNVGDKTGTLGAVWWDYAAAPNKDILKNGLLDVGGDVSSYNGKMQLTVKGLAPASNADMTLFEKITKYDPNTMWSDFRNYARWFENETMSLMAQKIVNSYPGFFTKPAATGMHHAFKHGLLEHTLQMLETGEKLFELSFYSEALNKDYCMFGLMFHDFCKIFEYGDGPDFKRTTLGIMVPHIPKMAAIIEKEGCKLGLNQELITYLQAIVLSHHRMLEWGSPCKPSTPEALFVHYVDNLHGDVFGVLQKLESDTGSDETVKHGYGDQAYTIVKKRFDKVLKDGGYSDAAGIYDGPSGEENPLGGF
jgi:3'-5' exoribonuclease